MTIENNQKNNDLTLYLLIAMSMLYITFKLTCNPLFFRQTSFIAPVIHFNIRVVSSAFIYPAIYVISDAIVALSNRRFAIFIILIGVLCDGLFSFSVNFITNLNIPNDMIYDQQLTTSYVNYLGPKIWALFYHGLIAVIVAAIAEVILFNFVFKKSKSFFLSTIFSVVITLLVHNTITDYQMLKSDHNAWKIIFNGITINVCIMIIYAMLITILLYSFKKAKFLNRGKIINKINT